MAQAIRKAVQETALEDDEGNRIRGGTIVSFKAYLELSTADFTPNASVVQLRSELQGSGVSLIDTPKSGRKNASDFMLAADMLAFAIDVPPPARIFLVSGDRDFAYGLGTLRNRGYEVVLMVPPIGAAPILQASANKVLRWRQDVLKVTKDAYGVPYQETPMNTSINAPLGKTAQSSPAIVPAQVSSAQASASQANNKPIISTPAGSSPPSSNKKLVTTEASSEQSHVFASLVAILQRLAKEGQHKPLRSATAIRLVTSDPKVYERAGATRWAEFAAVAQANGLVTLGSDGTPGSEWIQLKTKETKDNSSSSSATPNGKQKWDPTEPYRPLPGGYPKSSYASSNDRPTSGSPATPHTPLKGDKSSTSTFYNSSSAEGDANVHLFFPLIEVHKSIKSTGSSKPLAAEVSRQLSSLQHLGSDVYAKAGCKGFKEYISLAERYGIGRLREAESPGVFTVQIHPRYSEIYTNQVTASASRIVDTTMNRNDVATRPNAASTAKLSKAATKEAGKNGNSSKDRTDASQSEKEDTAVLASVRQRNSHTSSYDPKAKGQNVWNGKTYPEEFVLLVKALLDQRDEGRFYSVDSFLHKLLNKLGVKGIKKGEDFAEYLARAKTAEVIEIQPGFIPNTRHVRLHRSLTAGSPKEDHSGSESSFSRTASSESAKQVTKSAPSGSGGNRRARAVWDDHVSGEDNERFWPLIGTLAQIYEEEKQPTASRSRLSGDIPKRFPMEGASTWTGAWYQRREVNGFWEYATLASEKGYVKIVGVEDRGHELIALSDRLFGSMFM